MHPLLGLLFFLPFGGPFYPCVLHLKPRLRPAVASPAIERSRKLTFGVVLCSDADILCLQEHGRNAQDYHSRVFGERGLAKL